MGTKKGIRCSEGICHWQWYFLIGDLGVGNIEEGDKPLNFSENSEGLGGPPIILSYGYTGQFQWQ
jgi:hypothetical protein